ncbi:MAG: hypothetical protein NVS3B20_07130 [Polyangiales bacterium]
MILFTLPARVTGATQARHHFGEYARALRTKGEVAEPFAKDARLYRPSRALVRTNGLAHCTLLRMVDDPRVGALLAGKYELSRPLGQGAFGAVYEGTNIEIGKRVAIKLIDPHYAKVEEITARFRQEARAASRIESEHIVQVFDVGDDPTHGLYMVMELLVGEDLATRLDREFKLSPAVAVHLAVQASRGLAKAHAAGVVHRDLKPANIFLCAREDGSIQVKIVDFGISKLLGEAVEEGSANRALTRTGTAVGTPNYMSPEQTRGATVDGRADIWALGALLYEMLAGEPVFAHHLTYEQTVLAIVHGPLPSLIETAPWVPPDLAEVVSKALTRDVEARIPDCTVFATLLTEAMPSAARPRREVSLYMEPSEPVDEVQSKSPRTERTDAEAIGHQKTLPASLPAVADAARQQTTSRRSSGGALALGEDDVPKGRWATRLVIGAIIFSAAVVGGAFLYRAYASRVHVDPGASSTADSQSSAENAESTDAGKDARSGSSGTSSPSTHHLGPKVFTKPAHSLTPGKSAPSHS